MKPSYSPSPERSGADATTNRQVSAGAADAALAQSMAAISQSSTMLTGIAQLAASELQLAMGSVGRMLGLVVVMGLLLIFAWLGFSVLVSWALGSALESVLAGLSSFLLVQALALFAAVLAMRSLAESASMPATRRQISELIDELQDDTPRQNPPHSPA